MTCTRMTQHDLNEVQEQDSVGEQHNCGKEVAHLSELEVGRLCIRNTTNVIAKKAVRTRQEWN